MAQVSGTANTMNALITAINNFIAQNPQVGNIIYAGNDPSLSTDQMIIFAMTKGTNTIYYSLSAKNSANPSYFQTNISYAYSSSLSVVAQTSSLYVTKAYSYPHLVIPTYANQTYTYWIQGGAGWLAFRVEQNACHEAVYFGFLNNSAVGYTNNVAVLSMSWSISSSGTLTIDSGGVFSSAYVRSPVYTPNKESLSIYDFGTNKYYNSNFPNTQYVATNCGINSNYSIRYLDLNYFRSFVGALTIPIIPVLVFEYNTSTTPAQALPVGYLQGVYATPAYGLQNYTTFSVGTNNYQVFTMLSGSNSYYCNFNGYAEVYLTNG